MQLHHCDLCRVELKVGEYGGRVIKTNFKDYEKSRRTMNVAVDIYLTDITDKSSHTGTEHGEVCQECKKRVILEAIGEGVML